MARKAYGNHATQVNLGTHPDDGTSPVGSAEWNEAPSTQGMLGFSEQTISSVDQSFDYLFFRVFTK